MKQNTDSWDMIIIHTLVQREGAQYRYCKMAASERCIRDSDISVMKRGRGYVVRGM